MFRDPYRHLFFEANAASHRISHESLGLKWSDQVIAERLNLGLGSRLLVAGLTSPEILPALRLRLGLTGQLVIVDPSDEALKKVSQNDAFWAMVLKANLEQIPIMEASMDAVLCWSSYMNLGPLSQVTNEFFRVLAPGGRVFITYSGRAHPLSPRPCLTGLQSLFIKTGFSRLDSEIEEDFFLFKAEKVAGFSLPMSRMGNA
ncbi:MAG: class I SAM-dependent methyltransferase [Deltaproteobacteria bacterium]|jgi:ubiquinone/menaquinone biosynthesis C-methylase UbiE|nr:class I SAM-dependent methyltransferase [Deltaproteobacteria bacterium]